MKILITCFLCALTLNAFADEIKKPISPAIEKMIRDSEAWLKMTDAEKIAFAQDKIKLKLKDPDSAQFKNVYVSTIKNICGEFNAKNSYGGYNGFALFYYSKFEDKADLNTKKEYFDIMCKS